ncbi:dGTP triphosphohydrolase [Ralstonia pseudosolanacearum]|uniref:dGTP triphosphohydrolase n=1 Tax=Ralstonia pseudosolanacearum TaxID=1310165 RepID=UPI00143315A0|nr:dNTP triphosphohydrolase [Ralstonia pseudosolanacearum]
MKTKIIALYGVNDAGREQPLQPKAVPQNYIDARSPYRRDYARLIHSPAFRRLQGKTQLFPGVESDFFRNRLTHSMEVAQIAEGIALQLNTDDPNFRENKIDLDLVQLAALAHDLGHPPFGHNGEYALDECMRQFGGFEGNAQTLRILSRLEKRDGSKGAPVGLNLTYRSLAAVLKYDKKIPSTDNEKKPRKKPVKGYYASEAKLVANIKAAVLQAHKAKEFKVLECQIMDLADDIAYSTYDLEDAFKAGFLTPLEVLHLANSPDFLKTVTPKVAEGAGEEVSPAVVRNVYIETFGGVVQDRLRNIDLGEPLDMVSRISEIYSASKALAGDGRLRTSFTSQLVAEFMAGVSAEYNSQLPALSEIKLKRETRIKIEALKHLAFETQIMSPRLKLVEYRGRDIVKGIFQAIDSEERGGHLLLPDEWRETYLSLKDDKVARKRLICDFVAGMTDRYAVEFYSRLSSVDSGLSFFKPM